MSFNEYTSYVVPVRPRAIITDPSELMAKLSDLPSLVVDDAGVGGGDGAHIDEDGAHKDGG